MANSPTMARPCDRELLFPTDRTLNEVCRAPSFRLILNTDRNTDLVPAFRQLMGRIAPVLLNARHLVTCVTMRLSDGITSGRPIMANRRILKQTDSRSGEIKSKKLYDRSRN